MFTTTDFGLPLQRRIAAGVVPVLRMRVAMSVRNAVSVAVAGVGKRDDRQLPYYVYV